MITKAEIERMYATVNTEIRTGECGPFLRTPLSNADIYTLLTAAARLIEVEGKLAAIRAALSELEAAYKRREHGGVAQDKCIRSIKEAITGE